MHPVLFCCLWLRLTSIPLVRLNRIPVVSYVRHSLAKNEPTFVVLPNTFEFNVRCTKPLLLHPLPWFGPERGPYHKSHRHPTDAKLVPHGILLPGLAWFTGMFNHGGRA